MTGMNPDRQTETRIRVLEEELLALRRGLLRVVALGVAAVVVAGLVLPVFSEEIDGEEVTVRAGTAWWTALVQPGPDGEGLAVALGVGFAGLLLVALVTLWSLVFEVAGAGGTRRLTWLRGWGIGLTALGSIVPVFFSAAASGDGPEDAGWGGVLLLGGAIAAAVLVSRESSHELWLDTRR